MCQNRTDDMLETHFRGVKAEIPGDRSHRGLGAEKVRCCPFFRKIWFSRDPGRSCCKSLEPGKEALEEAFMRLFSPKILLEDGQINRSAMAEIIFKDPSKRAKVDSLTHPLVWKAVLEKRGRGILQTVGGHRSCYSFKRIS